MDAITDTQRQTMHVNTQLGRIHLFSRDCSAADVLEFRRKSIDNASLVIYARFPPLCLDTCLYLRPLNPMMNILLPGPQGLRVTKEPGSITEV